ncbi:retrotransposon protein, putative, ty1-copia subclass [Tanacetum coccineum]
MTVRCFPVLLPLAPGVYFLVVPASHNSLYPYRLHSLLYQHKMDVTTALRMTSVNEIASSDHPLSRTLEQEEPESVEENSDCNVVSNEADQLVIPPGTSYSAATHFGGVTDAELSINIILSGLPAIYNQFVLSYQMNRKETSIMKLHRLLQAAEQGIKKIDVPSTSAALVLIVGHNTKKRKTSHSNWKGKSDRGSKRKAKSNIVPTSDPKEVVCFYCNTKGHWKRSCLKYLKDLKYGKVKKGSHSDVCGPFRSATKDGKCYYVTFTDDFSRYGYVYRIKHKSDTFEVFKRYQNEVENQLGKKIKLTPPRTPQLNRDDERRNRTLLDMVRSMMSQAKLPISFWGYALETASHILNLVPTKKVSKTPFEMRKGKRPSRSGSKIDLEEIQETGDEEPIVNTDTQQEVVTPVKPDDISLPIR